MGKKEDLIQEATDLEIEVSADNTVAELEEMIAKANADLEQDDDGGEDQEQEEYPDGSKFFRSAITGLFIKTGNPIKSEGNVAPRGVRFVPYHFSRFDGDVSKFGYLATADAKALKILETDINVVQISEEEYLEETDVTNPKIKRAKY